jgi:EpsI family protein
MPNFISEVFAREYSRLDRNSQFAGESAYGYDAFLVILDAGNFHHPGVCFRGAGFVMKELNDTEFHISGRTIKAPTLYAQKGSESLLVIYWISIDKELVNWTEQKIKQLWYSMFNRKKAGLMIRVCIPVEKGDIESSLATAKEFFNDISQNIPPEQIDYIFGKST